MADVSRQRKPECLEFMRLKEVKQGLIQNKRSADGPVAKRFAAGIFEDLQDSDRLQMAAELGLFLTHPQPCKTTGLSNA